MSSSDVQVTSTYALVGVNMSMILSECKAWCYLTYQSGLREKLEFLKKRELEWLERMDVTATPPPVGAAANTSDEDKEELDPNDDFKREMHL